MSMIYGLSGQLSYLFDLEIMMIVVIFVVKHGFIKLFEI